MKTKSLLLTVLLATTAALQAQVVIDQDADHAKRYTYFYRTVIFALTSIIWKVRSYYIQLTQET
jgi:hypothetical protein